MWILVAVDVAWACKIVCESRLGGDGLVQPLDGASDVPVDAQPVVLSSETVRLVGPDGDELAASVRPSGATQSRLVRFTPEADLLPDTRYQIVEETSGSSSPIGSFTTGRGRVGETNPAPSAPTAAGRVKFDLRPGHGLGSACGGAGEGVVIDVSWMETTGLYELRATREDGTALVYQVGADTFPLGWEVPCLRTVPELSPREPLLLEVRSVDLRGRAGPWSEPLHTSAAPPR